MKLVWSQLWMYYHLPRWIPILAVALIGISLLYFVDSFGWIYGLFLWIFVSVLFLDKLSQGILPKGMYRIHQGMVLGYYLSILGITLIYFGGNEFIQNILFGTTSSLSSTSSSSSLSSENMKEVNKNGDTRGDEKVKISGLGNEALSPFYLSLLITSTILSIILMYLLSVIRCKIHVSNEDRSVCLLVS